MTPDQRVVQARELLKAIRNYPVATRPLSVLQPEDAELRRVLEQLLTPVDDYEREEREHDVTGLTPSGGARLSPEAVLVLGQALADGISWRESGSECIACEASPASRCDDHLADDEKIAGYLELAAELGMAVSS